MISGNVLSIGSPQVSVHSPAGVENGFRLKPQQTVQFDASPLDDLVAFSSQPTKLSILRQVVE